MLKIAHSERPTARVARPAHTPAPPQHPSASLQDALGNQGVLHRLAHSHSLPMPGSGAGNQATLRQLRATRPALQKKLIIGESSDQYEQEADRAAGEVMSGGPTALSAPTAATPGLQRKCSCGGTCSKCQDDLLQRKADGGAASQQRTAPPIVHHVLQSPGQSLEPAVRTFMESRFGYDFGPVRVHQDAAAADSAAAVQARAYTVGSHVVFGRGRYDSGEGGLGLLAHELTHVIQQSGGAAAQPTRLSRAPVEWQMKTSPQTNQFKPQEDFHLEFYTHSCAGCHDRGHRILLRTITSIWDLFDWAVEQRMNGLGVQAINAIVYSKDVEATNDDREAAAYYIYFHQKAIDDEANARLTAAAAKQAQYQAAQGAEKQHAEDERKKEILEKQRAFAKSDPSGCPALSEAKIDAGPYVNPGITLPYDKVVPEPDPTDDPDLDETSKILVDPKRLEQLYYDASKGNYRAAWLVCQMEAGARVKIGIKWADDLHSLSCTFLYNCGLDTRLPFSDSTASGLRIRSVISKAFKDRAFDIKLARGVIGDVLTLIGGAEIAKAGFSKGAILPPDSPTTLGTKDPGFWTDTQPTTANPTVGKLQPGAADVTDISSARKPPAPQQPPISNVANDNDVAQQAQQAVGQTTPPTATQTTPPATTPNRPPRARTPRIGGGQVTAAHINSVPGMQALLNKMEKLGLTFDKLGFKDVQEVINLFNSDAEAALKEINRRIDVETVRSQKVGSPADRKPDTPHSVSEAQRKWYREEVLGRTPSKTSPTGRIVRERMRSQNRLRTENGRDMFQDRRTSQWYPVDSSDIHMGHTADAVTWWNEKGRYYAPQSPEVRDWMENPKHYEFEYGPENSRAGASIGEEYLAPVEPPIDTSNWPRPLRGDD